MLLSDVESLVLGCWGLLARGGCCSLSVVLALLFGGPAPCIFL